MGDGGRWRIALGVAALMTTPAAAQERADLRSYSSSTDIYTPALPGQRLAPTFRTDDYLVRDPARWGLPPAPTGLSWVRYWDDAALIDRDGVVRDVRAAIGWDRERPTYATAAPRLAYSDDILREDPPTARRVFVADQSGYDRRCFEDRDDTPTVVGAIGGAVVGGVAGNVIAGRGSRTAGTLIGGGLGALAGGVAGSELGRDRRPIGPCPGDAVDTRGYPEGGTRRTVTYDSLGGTTTTITTGGTTTTTVVEEYLDDPAG